METEGLSNEIEPDPRESRFELPPIEVSPLAERDEKVQAVRRLVEQAERERATGTQPS